MIYIYKFIILFLGIFLPTYIFIDYEIVNKDYFSIFIMLLLYILTVLIIIKVVKYSKKLFIYICNLLLDPCIPKSKYQETELLDDNIYKEYSNDKVLAMVNMICQPYITQRI